jgi:hypothetical protein
MGSAATIEPLQRSHGIANVLGRVVVTIAVVDLAGRYHRRGKGRVTFQGIDAGIRPDVQERSIVRAIDDVIEKLNPWQFHGPDPVASTDGPKECDERLWAGWRLLDGWLLVQGPGLKREEPQGDNV